MAFGNGKAKKDKVTESGSGLDEKENGDNNSTIAKNKSKDYMPENWYFEISKYIQQWTKSTQDNWIKTWNFILII